MDKVSAGKNPPQEVNVLIEIPKGSSVKYELDKESNVVFVDRFLYTAMYFPFNYGFIPNTLSPDGDPSDVLVLCEHTVAPGVVIPVKPIGMLEMEDESGLDAKIIAVPTLKIDPFFGAYQDITEIPEALKNKIKHFFENYKTLEPGKWVKLKEWKDKEVAFKEIKKAFKNK
ncbi:MAG: inorganic pyrophosphatase [Candidatus Levybacteria bacterium RIFCSPHIGHO2_01_FULL_36_15]|nr:MAG: inorganic pyrophosphatase [Candidatus Levybacteria bacterium RIFCSPHIGHO2_01_FULL_36_15]OGH38823.1 MAG: inorganic pyrophosphatase [Candidatus Levybacteria bacterium RIFCSPLOWO2_01_FULL_36_10]